MNTEKNVRMPICSVEAEESVLGSVLLSNDALSKIQEKIISPEFFANQWNQKIYKAIMALSACAKPIDYVTLVAELESENELAKVGGVEYVTNLTTIVPSAANYEHYCDIVIEKYKQRRLAEIGDMMSESAYSNISSENIMSNFNAEILKLQNNEENSTKQLRVVAKEVKDSLDNIVDTGVSDNGVKMAFPRLADLMPALKRGTLTLLGARPAVGKTSFALNLVKQLSIFNDYKTLIFSLEMTKEELAERIMGDLGNFDTILADKGMIPKDKIENAYNRLSKNNITIDDKGSVTLSYLYNKASLIKREQGLDIIFIDYIQLIHGVHTDNKVQEITEISRFLKILAKELNIPIVALSQLNRDKSENEVPSLRDLRDSGSLEQDADNVLFLYLKDKVTIDDYVRPEFLTIAKQRGGCLGTIGFSFLPHRQRFIEARIINNKEAFSDNESEKTRQVKENMNSHEDMEQMEIGDIFKENEK